MGFDTTRFEENIDEELICPICTGVFEDPVQARQCEHAFCEKCIHEWLSHQSTCPIDRLGIDLDSLDPVPRILKTLLMRLNIRCEFQPLGCPAIVKMDSLKNHISICEFNPNLLVTCDKGCGMNITKSQSENHNCIRALHDLIEEQRSCIQELKSENTELRATVGENVREIQMLKDSFRSLNISGVPVRFRELAPPDPNNEEIHRWLSTLRPGRVSRWGGMISTPDSVLQAVIRCALRSSSCPPALLHDLMANAHERSWPSGLNSLETRQQNRRLYDNYVTKRVPGKQAVIVMKIENEHMPDNLILNPGLVMIFAHGVE